MSHQDQIRWTLRWLFLKGELTLEEARSLGHRLDLGEEWLSTTQGDDAEALHMECRLDRESTAALEAEIDRSGAFERTRKLALTRRLQHQQEQIAAPQLFAQLMGQPQKERARTLRARPEFHNRALVDLLLQESWESLWSNLDRAESLNRLALLLVESLDEDRYGREVLADLKARAWAFLGNIHRRRNQWSEVTAAFEKAEWETERGTHDPLVRARVLHLKASALEDRRRLPQALDLMNTVVTLYEKLGENHLAGRTLLNRSNILREMADLEGCIADLRRAAKLIDPQVEPQLELFVHHNLMFYLCDWGKEEEAARLLERYRSLYLDYPAPIYQLRLRWLEGKIALGTGGLAEAEAAFQETRRGFEEQEASYEAALAGLDLAAVYALQRRTTDLKELASALFTTFQTHDIHREATAALIVFRQAADLEQVTLEVVKRISAQVERSQYLPPDDPS